MFKNVRVVNFDYITILIFPLNRKNKEKLTKIKWILDTKNPSIRIEDKPITIQMYFFIKLKEFNDDDFKHQCSSSKKVKFSIKISLAISMVNNYTNIPKFWRSSYPKSIKVHFYSKK
jgi:hypothetical protein